MFFCLVKDLQEKQGAGEAGVSLSHLLINILPKACVDLQTCCAALCPEPSHSATAGHPQLYHGPAVTPAHARQLSVTIAAGILGGLISTLHTALKALKKIPRKCKAMSA